MTEESSNNGIFTNLQVQIIHAQVRLENPDFQSIKNNENKTPSRLGLSNSRNYDNNTNAINSKNKRSSSRSPSVDRFIPSSKGKKLDIHKNELKSNEFETKIEYKDNKPNIYQYLLNKELIQDKSIGKYQYQSF